MYSDFRDYHDVRGRKVMGTLRFFFDTFAVTGFCDVGVYWIKVTVRVVIFSDAPSCVRVIENYHKAVSIIIPA